MSGCSLVILVDNALRLVAPAWFGMGTATPDLPLITALYIGFRARNTNQLGLAIALGIFADCFSSRPLGHFAFLYGCAAYLALQVRRYVPSDAYVSHVVGAFFCTFTVALIGLLMAVITVPGPIGPGFLRSVLTAATSSFFAPFVFAAWDRSRFFRRALGSGRRYEFVR